MVFLDAHDIETRRWYWPTVIEHPAFRALQVAGQLETVRMLGERLIGLPFHPFLAPEDIDTVISVFGAYLAS